MSDNYDHTQRRKRQFSQRWEEIVRTAAVLFAIKGFHRTTTKEIAEAAKVSEGTLYNYFENKDDILFGILTQLTHVQPNFDAPKPTLVMDARAFLKYLLDQSKGFTDQNQSMMQTIVSEILSNPELRDSYYQQLIAPSLKMIETQLHMRKELGQIRNLDTALTARMISSLLIGMFLLQAIGDPLVNEHWEEFSKLTTAIIFDGISP